MTTLTGQLIKMALAEDIGTGDITSRATVSKKLTARGIISAKQELVVAGLDIAKDVFLALDSNIKWTVKVKEGELAHKGDVVAIVDGTALALLQGERTALNFIQRLSGIATKTREFVNAIKGTKTKILDTRKTTPTLRVLEKYAVKTGGGTNHRMGLYDHFLIKNNHISVAGSITLALEKAMKAKKAGQKIEVETRNLDDVKEALALKPDTIMLDNMSVEKVIEAVALVKGKVKLEVSGNINIHNIRQYAEAGVDFISIGALTHSAPAADLNMLISVNE